MSEEKFWNSNITMLKPYTEAEKIRIQARNHDMWMQGAYIYDGISRALSNAFRKKGAQPIGYVNSPYPLTQEEADEREYQKMLQKEKEFKASMVAFMEENNKKWQQKSNKSK